MFHFEDLAVAWPDMPADVEVAYAQCADFVAYLAGRHGPGAMGQLLDGVAAGEQFETAFGKAFRSSLTVEENFWREGLATRFGWLPLTTSMQLVWLLAPGLCVIAYARRRRQRAARMEAMAAEEAAEEAALRVLAAEAAARGLPAPSSLEEVEQAQPGAAAWVEPPSRRADRARQRGRREGRTAPQAHVALSFCCPHFGSHERTAGRARPPGILSLPLRQKLRLLSLPLIRALCPKH